MNLTPENIYASSICLFMGFGLFLYRMGLLLEILQQSGRALLVTGVLIMMMAAVMGMILRKKRHVAALTALSCLVAAGHNWLMLRLFDNLEAAAESLSSMSMDLPDNAITLSSEQIEVLRAAHVYITYAFFILGLVAAFLAVVQIRSQSVRESTEQASTLIQDVLGEGNELKLEYGRYKYCPKCLYQAEVDSVEEYCPVCKVPLKMPSGFKPDDDAA